jgi:hypothetical protein
MTMLLSPFAKNILRFLLRKTLLKVGSWVTITALQKLKHKSLNKLGIKMVEKISRQYFEHKNYLDKQMEFISRKIDEIMKKKIKSGEEGFVIGQSDFIDLVRLMESLTENKEMAKEEQILGELMRIGLEMRVEVDRETGEEVVIVEEVDVFEGFEEIN